MAAFRECLRRVGAWKGFKLWGLSKADLAAIQDASSHAGRATGEDLSSVPTLASICKVFRGPLFRLFELVQRVQGLAHRCSVCRVSPRSRPSCARTYTTRGVSGVALNRVSVQGIGVAFADQGGAAALAVPSLLPKRVGE